MTVIIKSNRNLKTDKKPSDDETLMLLQPTESGNISIRIRGITEFKDEDGRTLELINVMPISDCIRLIQQLKDLCEHLEPKELTA